MTNKPRLRPKKSELVQKLLDKEKNELKNLVDQESSPLNIILPEMFGRNIQQFENIFEELKINGKIYFAHKANKSEALVAEAKKQGINLDVASINELKNAMKNGFKGEELIATGPKNQEFIQKAIKNDCLISVDNLTELKQISQTSEENTRVIIRLSGFQPYDRDKVPNDSRFGIDQSQTEEVKQILTKNQNLDFKGFAFHLPSSNKRQKLIAVGNLFDRYTEFLEEGLEAEIINIGGSFGLNYIENKEDWEGYIEKVRSRVKGEEKEMMTWKDSNFGLKKRGDSVQGNLNAYNFYQETGKHHYLKDLLQSEVPGWETTFQKLLQQHMLQLVIEPGRPLLDEAGLTIAQTNFIKETENQETLVGLDMNQTNLNTHRWEYLLDPEIIKNNQKHRENLDNAEKDKGVFFVGNLCLETDFIMEHKVFLEKTVSPGDLAVFLNTAAYHMDFGEATPIQHRTANKIVAKQKQDQFEFYKDSEYREKISIN